MTEPDPIDTSDVETKPDAVPLSDSAQAVQRPRGRPGLTRERFDDAWRTLTERGAGREPTLRELRRYLGSGSLSTLTRYRRQQAREAQIREEQPATGSHDAALLATVATLVDSLAEETAAAADERIAKHRKQADARVNTAEQIAEKALQDSALLKQRADTAEAELHRCREELGTSKAALTNLQTEHLELATAHASLVSKHEASLQRLADLEAQQLASEAREQTREQQWQQEREQHAGALSDQKAQRAMLASELASAQGDLNTQQATLRAFEKEELKWQQQSENHSQDKQHWLSEQKAAKHALALQQQQIDALKVEYEKQLSIEREQLVAERHIVAQLTEQIHSQQLLMTQLHQVQSEIMSSKGNSQTTDGSITLNAES